MMGIYFIYLCQSGAIDIALTHWNEQPQRLCDFFLYAFFWQSFDVRISVCSVLVTYDMLHATYAICITIQHVYIMHCSVHTAHVHSNSSAPCSNRFLWRNSMIKGIGWKNSLPTLRFRPRRAFATLIRIIVCAIARAFQRSSMQHLHNHSEYASIYVYKYIELFNSHFNFAVCGTELNQLIFSISCGHRRN